MGSTQLQFSLVNPTFVDACPDAGYTMIYSWKQSNNKFGFYQQQKEFRRLRLLGLLGIPNPPPGSAMANTGPWNAIAGQLRSSGHPKHSMGSLKLWLNGENSNKIWTWDSSNLIFSAKSDMGALNPWWMLQLTIWMSIPGGQVIATGSRSRNFAYAIYN